MSIRKKRYSNGAHVCAYALVALVCLQVLVMPVWVQIRFENRHTQAIMRYADTLLKLEANTQLLLKFTNAATDSLFQKLVWEDEHEFLYAGQYYDVVAEQKTNGIVTYYAKADGHEVALRSALAKTTDATPEGALLKVVLIWQGLPVSPLYLASAIPCQAVYSWECAALRHVCTTVKVPPPRSV